jgi:hypothetical protein
MRGGMGRHGAVAGRKGRAGREQPAKSRVQLMKDVVLVGTGEAQGALGSQSSAQASGGGKQKEVI